MTKNYEDFCGRCAWAESVSCHLCEMDPIEKVPARFTDKDSATKISGHFVPSKLAIHNDHITASSLHQINMNPTRTITIKKEVFESMEINDNGDILIKINGGVNLC